MKDLFEELCKGCNAKALYDEEYCDACTLKDDIAEHDAKVRAEAIDEFARAYEKVEVYGCIDCKHLDDDVHCWECIAEQLKEQKE